MPNEPDEKDCRIKELESKLEEAKADAKLCRGAMAAQEAMIQNALEPLGCIHPFDHHAAEWAADQVEGLKSERDAARMEVLALRERFGEYANCVNARVKAIQAQTGYEWPWAAQEILEAQLKDALKDTSATAQRVKDEIERDVRGASPMQFRAAILGEKGQG